MSSTTKVGDLVMVVRTCCAKTAQRSIGKAGVVTEILPSLIGWLCEECGARGSDARPVFANEPYSCAPISWLIKIDPPALPESIERDEQVPA